MTQQPTAAVLVIGNEILSGRTQDVNIAFLGDALNEHGIRLAEARIVADIEEEIVAAVNALRVKYDYVFTTGGIGPTHDDITADSIAAAFGVDIDYHPEVYPLLKEAFEARGVEANEARMRMARVPDGASLISNDISLAPGFQLGNVFVLAGVPRIARSMFEAAKSRLTQGAPVLSRSIRVHVGEGTIAAPLAELQEKYAGIDIGSYPWSDGGIYGTNLVLRCMDEALLERAAGEVFEMAASLGANPRYE